MEAIMHLDRSTMETNQANKFICKFCNKNFKCGKSLGGHIRIHLNGNSKRSDLEEEEFNFNTSKSTANGVVFAGEYSLRENPKKTTRFTLDSSIDRDYLVCRECGKGFQSLKALCGHMACHSKNGGFEDQSGSSEKLRDLVMDGYSDTETSSLSKKRRSKRTRCKLIGGNYSSSITSTANGVAFGGFDDFEHEQEQEEVAMSLMMLSRDSGFKKCNDSVDDSFGKDSVAFELKPASQIRINSRNGVNCVKNCSGEVSELKKVKERDAVVGYEKDHFVNSSSDCFPNSANRVKSEINGCTRGNELKQQKLDLISRLDREFDDQFVKRLSRFRRIRTKFTKDEAEKDQINQDIVTSISYDSANTDSSDAEERGIFNSLVGLKTSNDSGLDSIVKFQSGRIKTPMEQKYSSSGKTHKRSGSRKGKVHKCPFCSKVFKSGQALGGHKRSHTIGGGEDRIGAIKQEDVEVSLPTLIDLNLPAPVEEESYESMAL